MKKIINGKMYNTETATEVYEYDNGYYGSDFKCMRETLYVKKTGEFFLCGSGGPLSKYARSCGNNGWCGGSDILPLTEEEAKIWCENYTDTDTYIELFGEPAE